MEKKLNELVSRLKAAFEQRLVSVILYGSAAGGEYQERFSDINIFCVLDRITPAELANAEAVFRWWISEGNPSPLLMSEEEVAGSTDCFAVEFTDMLERRRLLHGRDVVEGLSIDRSFYRAQVEYDLRSRLLRLRQKAAGILHDKQLLLRLMADSVSTFLVLARHALLLRGEPCPPSRRATVAKVEPSLGIAAEPFETLLSVRDGATGAASDVPALFVRYLQAVEGLVRVVDQMDR